MLRSVEGIYRDGKIDFSEAEDWDRPEMDAYDAI